MSEATMSPEALDEAMRARPYPRVSKERIEEKIASTHYIFQEAPGIPPGLTICIITMKNGFFVLGKSAPVDLRNFNPEIGRHFAYEDAFRQLWPLEGFLLKEQQHQAALRNNGVVPAEYGNQ